MSSPVDPSSDDQIAWRAIGRHTPVLDAAGAEVGVVDELLGSNEEDIFHGIVLRHHLLDRHKVVIPADDITSITRHAVATSLTAAEIEALPKHTAERAYDLGWVTMRFTYQYGPSSYTSIPYETPGWVKER